MCNSAFDPLRSEFTKTFLHLPEPGADDLEDVDGDLWMPADQIKQCCFRPTDVDRLDQGYRFGRICPVGKESHRPKHLTRADEANHQLRAVLIRLGNANLSLDQRVAALGCLALEKDCRA